MLIRSDMCGYKKYYVQWKKWNVQKDNIQMYTNLAKTN